MRAGERGDSLIEVVISCAIIAVVVGSIGAALIAAAHRFGPDPVTQTLEQTVANEMHVAVDLAKYQGSSVPSTTIATTAPLPSNSPLPITISLVSTTAASGSVTLTITAASVGDSSKSATLTQNIAAPAPVPGSTVTSPSSGAAPQ